MREERKKHWDEADIKPKEWGEIVRDRKNGERNWGETVRDRRAAKETRARQKVSQKNGARLMKKRNWGETKEATRKG